MTPEEALLKAVEILERDGWIQGEYFEQADDLEAEGTTEALVNAARTAPVCSMGAIYRAVFGQAAVILTGKGDTDAQWYSRELRELAYQADALLRTQTEGDGVITWNDASGRTKEDVILAFKKAANHDS